MATNTTYSLRAPSLQPPTLYSMPPLLPGVSDLHLSLIIPTAVHWITSAVFELLDRSGWLIKYRIHTSAEDKLKNQVSRLDCFIATIRCQVLQTLLGVFLAWGSEADLTGSEDYDIAIWTYRVHAILAAFRYLLFLTGIDFAKMAAKVPADNTWLFLIRAQDIDREVAKAIYWCIVPIVRITCALLVADFWMYCLHRLVHTNKWMYKHVHSIHHRLYVPYAWGASYGHLFDNIVVDGLGYSLGTWTAGLTNRLAMILFAYSSFKNVTDHCGYSFPCNPVQMLTGSTVANSLFHDVHHQTWGLKKNFGAHLTIWDRIMGTHFDDKEQIERNRTRGRVEADALLIQRKRRSGAEKLNKSE